MVDPKFNEIPVEGELLTEEERGRNAEQVPLRGLSINDTIARDANLSVGGRGVDTSGVAAGAGAGAGSIYVTPTDTGSPAPEIVPDGRGTGVTPRGDALSGKTSTDRTAFDTERTAFETDRTAFDTERTGFETDRTDSDLDK